MAYTNIIGRADVSDAMVPEQEIPGILKSATEASVIMTKARRTPMSAKVAKQAVLAKRARSLAAASSVRRCLIS